MWLRRPPRPYNLQVYVDFIDDAFFKLQALRLEADTESKEVFKVA